MGYKVFCISSISRGKSFPIEMLVFFKFLTKEPNILLVLKEAEFSYNRPRFGVLSLTGILLSRDAVNAFETDLFDIAHHFFLIDLQQKLTHLFLLEH